MSCLNKIDPYNNAPPSRKGKGGCSSGKCGSGGGGQQPQQPQQQYVPQIPQYTGRTTGMSQRPNLPQQRPDPQTENQLLMADLQLAISYIQQLGGTWPPPGH